ncbi:conjugal transfer protein [Enterococcus faecalis]|uniref:conjugal transfer protein n=1 Tax=Enterococcus faecalis TaxID=1351 RepID=UPI000766B6C6|nr:conjugal transfer protein [Enterococcus faecalis]CWX05268.1 TcpE family [Enterococcus faecalis]
MKHFDYSRGLKAPYSLQVIKSPKGKIVWYFAQPLSLAYLVMLFLGIVLTGIFWKLVPLPLIFGINLNLMIMLYFPNKVARWYTETEFEGKPGLAFLKDGFVYVKNYVLDNRSIISFERVKEIEEFSFKR